MTDEQFASALDYIGEARAQFENSVSPEQRRFFADINAAHVVVAKEAVARPWRLTACQIPASILDVETKRSQDYVSNLMSGNIELTEHPDLVQTCTKCPGKTCTRTENLELQLYLVLGECLAELVGLYLDTEVNIDKIGEYLGKDSLLHIPHTEKFIFRATSKETGFTWCMSIVPMAGETLGVVLYFPYFGNNIVMFFPDAMLNGALGVTIPEAELAVYTKALDKNKDPKLLWDGPDGSECTRDLWAKHIYGTVCPPHTSVSYVTDAVVFIINSLIIPMLHGLYRGIKDEDKDNLDKCLKGAASWVHDQKSIIERCLHPSNL